MAKVATDEKIDKCLEASTMKISSVGWEFGALAGIGFLPVG